MKEYRDMMEEAGTLDEIKMVADAPVDDTAAQIIDMNTDDAEKEDDCILFLKPEKVCKGQNEMRSVLMNEALEKGAQPDRVLIRQVFGNGDYGVCLCLKDGEIVAMACWERTVNGSKREYRFCPLAAKFEALSKAV